jgi:hypothetical protein
VVAKLQAGRSLVRIPMRSLDFSINLLLPGAQVPGLPQPLTEMGARKFPGGKARPDHEADNLTAIGEPLRPVTGIALLFYYSTSTATD